MVNVKKYSAEIERDYRFLIAELAVLARDNNVAWRRKVGFVA